MNGRVLDNNLKALMSLRQLSQEDLAERVGVTRVTVNRIENGKWVPSTALALKIAGILGVPLEEVFWLARAEKEGCPHRRGLSPLGW